MTMANKSVILRSRSGSSSGRSTRGWRRCQGVRSSSFIPSPSTPGGGAPSPLPPAPAPSPAHPHLVGESVSVWHAPACSDRSWFPSFPPSPTNRLWSCPIHLQRVHAHYHQHSRSWENGRRRRIIVHRRVQCVHPLNALRHQLILCHHVSTPMRTSQAF